jgi:hypothetical protein
MCASAETLHGTKKVSTQKITLLILPLNEELSKWYMFWLYKPYEKYNGCRRESGLHS